MGAGLAGDEDLVLMGHWYVVMDGKDGDLNMGERKCRSWKKRSRVERSR